MSRVGIRAAAKLIDEWTYWSVISGLLRKKGVLRKIRQPQQPQTQMT